MKHKVQVSLLPQHIDSDVCVIVDVLRFASLAALLFERGVHRLYVSRSSRACKAIAHERSCLLLAERAGVLLEGANYGHSPAEIHDLRFDGRDAVVLAKNTPNALTQLNCQTQRCYLAGLINAKSVAEHLLHQSPHRLHIACSGFNDVADLDDALAAGYLLSAYEEALTEPCLLAGEASLCKSLLKAFPSPLEALWHSQAGQYLRKYHLENDLAIAAKLSCVNAVPQLVDSDIVEDSQVYQFVNARETLS